VANGAYNVAEHRRKTWHCLLENMIHLQQLGDFPQRAIGRVDSVYRGGQFSVSVFELRHRFQLVLGRVVDSVIGIPVSFGLPIFCVRCGGPSGFHRTI